MKYIQFTHVDAATGIPCTVEPMRRGPAWPKVKGLKVEFGDQRNWPTNTPMFFGTCDDDADTSIRGVIQVLPEEQYNQERKLETDSSAQRARDQRNYLLVQSDWTQAEDVPEALLNGIDRQTWAAYRQALRDVPQQEGFPWNVQWPDAP